MPVRDSPSCVVVNVNEAILGESRSTHMVSACLLFRLSVIAAFLSVLAIARIEIRLRTGAEPLILGLSSLTAASKSLVKVWFALLGPYADELFAAISVPELLINCLDRRKTYRANDEDSFQGLQAQRSRLPRPFSFSKIRFVRRSGAMNQRRPPFNRTAAVLRTPRQSSAKNLVWRFSACPPF